MSRLPLLISVFLSLSAAALAAQARPGCREWRPEELRENPSEAELRCRFGIRGPGRFGLLSYLDVPVYQPDTPMPGTHIVGIRGHARPMIGESYEEWEWRMLRAPAGPSAHSVHRALDLLHPEVAARIIELERRLRERGVAVRRLETWRSRERQAYLFQQGRSRPGHLATTTLTSWHSPIDSLGRPAGRAADYDVAASQLERFHATVQEVGLQSFGADSNDRGHVFLPPSHSLPAGEVVLLRVLPRVPEVTLQTGLPVDRLLPPGGRASLRQATVEFAREPFVARPTARVAKAFVVPSVMTRHLESKAPPTRCPVEPPGRRRNRAAAGGVPCEPLRTGAPAEDRPARSTDG